MRSTVLGQSGFNQNLQSKSTHQFLNSAEVDDKKKHKITHLFSSHYLADTQTCEESDGGSMFPVGPAVVGDLMLVYGWYHFCRL